MSRIKCFTGQLEKRFNALTNEDMPEYEQRAIATTLLLEEYESIHKDLSVFKTKLDQSPEALKLPYNKDEENKLISTYNSLKKSISSKMEEVGDVDISKIVFGTMHDESLSFVGGDSYTNDFHLKPEEVKAKYKKTREAIFSITPKDLENPQDYFIPFQPSRGIANIVRNDKGQPTSATNNLLDTGIITEADLFTPIVQIPTRGKTSFGSENDKVNMPVGKPIFNYLNNLFFLNTRNLTDNEANNIANVLVAATNQRLEKGEVSPQIDSYLRGVIYFKEPKKGDKATRNQVYFKEGKLFIGDKGQNFDITDLDAGMIASVLRGSYVYVDNKHLLEFAKAPKSTPFEELTTDKDGNIQVSKTWPSYQHYLLQKREDGSLAPLTTNIITPQNSNELPIIQKYPIMEIQALKIDTSVVPTEKEKTVTRKEILSTKPEEKSSGSKTLNISLKSLGKKEVKNEEPKKEEGKKEEPKTRTLNISLASLGKKPATEVKKDTEAVQQKEVEKPASNNITLESIVKPGNKFTSINGKDVYEFNAYGKDKITVLKNGSTTGLIIPSEPSKWDSYLRDQMEYLTYAAGRVDSKDDPFGDDVSSAPDMAATRLDTKTFTITGDVAKEEDDVKVMLPNVSIEILKNMATTLGGGRAWGYALPHLIAVYEAAPYGVRYHEAFEQVFNFILSNKERKALYNEFKQRKGTFETFEGSVKNYSDASFMEAKEELADEFAEFKTNGKIVQSTPAKKGFFEKLWSLLKELFTGKPLSVENAFYNLSKGGYAGSRITTPINAEPQYKRTVANTPESLVQDMIIGMTSKLFINKWTKDASLIQQLEENEKEATQTLFDQLLEGLVEYFEGGSNKSLASILKAEVELNPAKRAEYTQLIYDVRKNWTGVKAQWGNYMEDLKSFLRTFDIAFTIDEHGNVQYSEDIVDIPEERSAADYNSESKLFMSAKNSASKTVKLLFATIAESQFVYDETTNKIGQIVKRYIGNQTNISNNQMLMPNLASYAQLFNYTLDNAANTNGIEKILTKLREKVSNTDKTKKPAKINANLEVLLNRLGYDRVAPVTTDTEEAGDYTVRGWEALDKPSRKMLLKMENTLSKQRPSFFVQMSPSKKEHRILATNISDKINQTKDEWVENMRGSDYAISSGGSIKFKPSVLDSNDFKFLNNLGIKFTEEQFKTLPQKEKTSFSNILGKLREDIKDYTTRPLPANPKPEDLPFNGRLTNLATIYSDHIEGNTSESQHANAEGEFTGNKILNNYVSYILNDANNVKTKEEFIRLNPQFNDLYMGDSDILNQLFDEQGNRTAFEIVTAIAEGRKNYTEGTNTSALTFGERLIYEINNNLNNIYYTLIPADSSTQWGLRLKNPLQKAFFKNSKEAAIEEYSQKMWKTLKNEVELAKDFKKRKSISALNTKDGDRVTGNSLRFFKEILPESLVKQLNTIIDEKGVPDEALYPKFKEGLLAFIKSRADNTIASLDSFRLLNNDAMRGTIAIAGMDTNFLAEMGKLSAQKVDDIFFYREANYIFQNIEMHKFLFNDPAQYKDAEKRIKSFLSGREYSNQSEALNVIHDKELNKSGDYYLKPSEFGYKVHSNSMNVQTISTFSSHTLTPEVKEAMGKAYDDVDVADAQSWAEPMTYREIQYKAGARFTNAQDELHEWLMAYQRSKMLEKGQFKFPEIEYSEELRKADKELLRREIPDTSVNILKPIVSGVRLENGVAIQYLYKTSTAPLYYYFVENTPAEQILLNMQRNGVGMLALDSAHKVGQQTNKITPLYDKEGKMNEFNTPATIDYKYFGIQVETGGVKDYQTQGSQLTKLATQNLMNFGVPIDWKGTKKEWDNRENGVSTPIYDLIQRHNEILSTMIVKRSEKLFKELGIKEGEFGYEYADKKKVADFILKELTRRELPNNYGVGIETNAEGEFNSPLEANVNYRKIKEILWSTIENNIARPKVSGGAKILLSALGYDEFKTEIVNGKPVNLSTKLKFYTKADGKTKACQIAIPFLFGTKILKQIEKSQGIKFSNQKEGFEHVRQYLNNSAEGRSLLEGIGFRIPTQGLNSVDFFEIAEFLPPQMGDCIIFPAEITKKAGSDFDVDKMSTYTKNFFIDNNGYPKAIPFYGTDAKAEEKISEFSLTQLLSQKVKPDATALDTVKIEEDSSVEEMFIKSLENEYYDVIRDLASLPENFDRLITPNDASQLKTISKEIDSLKGISNRYKLSNATRLIDSTYMSIKRHLFLIMKKGVGIAAVGNTNLALNQLSDFSMAIPQYLVQTLYEKPNFKLRFKYNDLKDGLIHLSGTKNGKDWLSDLHSQVIDGTVDVAKDEWLANMLGDADALSKMLFLYKAGVSPKTAAYYINQPAIQEYMKLKGIHRNISKIAPWVKEQAPWFTEEDVRKKILSLKRKMTKKERAAMYASKPEIYNDEMMKEMIGKEYKDLSAEQNMLQVQMLHDYIGLERITSNLFTVIDSYNYDTTKFRSSEIADNKALAYQKASTKEGIEGETDKILSSSFIGSIKKAVESTNAAFNSLLNTQKGQAKNVLNKMLLKFYIQFFSLDDKVYYQQKAESSLIDFVTQTQGEFGGWKLNALIPALFLKKGNIAEMVKAAQTHSILKNNKVIQNIQAVEDKKEGALSYIRLKEQDFDTYTSNLFTDSLKELADGNVMVKVGDKTISSRTLLDYILLSQILQYGTARTKGSFLHLVPNNIYAELVNPVLRSIDNADEWYDYDYFYRNNWNDNKLVPEASLSYDYRDEAFYAPTFTIEGLKADVIHQPESFKNKPFIKVTTIDREDRTNRTVDLYKRVDVADNIPLITKVGSEEFAPESKVLYMKVNKLGGEHLKEYAHSSFLPENKRFDEVSSQNVIDALETNGISFKGVELTKLSPIEEDVVPLGEEVKTSENKEEDENAPFQIEDTFEEFKNNLQTKDC